MYVDMVDIPLFTRLYTSQVVQDFFHQQYFNGDLGLSNPSGKEPWFRKLSEDIYLVKYDRIHLQCVGIFHPGDGKQVKLHTHFMFDGWLNVLFSIHRVDC